MDRVVHIARSFAEADAWDHEQARDMTPDERLEAARVLRDRVYGPDAADLRAGAPAVRRFHR